MTDARYAGPIVEATAAEALGASKAIAIVAGQAVLADQQTAGHRGLVRGITTAAAASGETARVQVFGPMRDLTWSWTPGLPIYVGEDGDLTQTPPTTGWLQPIAVADTATQIFVDPQPEAEREKLLALPFAWGDATPATIGVATANRLVLRVELWITTAFNGASPTLQVGRSVAPGELLATTQNDPASIGGYETTPNLKYASDTTLLLTITPGVGASAGAGLLLVHLQR